MSSDVPAPSVLPRGRHNLPLEVVRASQRERLLQAMLACVGERGYGATTVPQVVAAAKVSRNAFYALFTDKADCFLALCDQLGRELIAEITAPPGNTWREALRAGTARYLRWWQERPAWSRTYLVELPSAGARLIDQRERQYAHFAALFEALAVWAREEDPGLPPLNPLATRAIVLAVTELVAEEVRAGRLDALDTLTGDVVDLIAALLTGGATVPR